MRERVGAVILNKNLLLTVKRVKNSETYWIFPGGGVEECENHKQALIRECKEELGVEVVVGKLLYENFFQQDGLEKQKEFFYACEIVGGELGTGDGPEFEPGSHYEGTREIEWLEISKLKNFEIRPAQLKEIFLKKDFVV